MACNGRAFTAWKYPSAILRFICLLLSWPVLLVNEILAAMSWAGREYGMALAEEFSWVGGIEEV